MNRELEALLLAYEAMLTAGSNQERKRLEAIYESRLEDALARVPNANRSRFIDGFNLTYIAWRKAQRKFPTLPPKALPVSTIFPSLLPEKNFARSGFGPVAKWPLCMDNPSLILHTVNKRLSRLGRGL